MPGLPRSTSPSSEHTADPIRQDYDLSINICSPENGHWGMMIYPHGEQSGRMYHVRSDERVDEDKFFYEERDQEVEPQPSFGRSVVSRLSSTERRRAAKIIGDHGSRDENIPRYSRGTNCQTFVSGILGKLEEETLVSAGTQAFFAAQHRRRGEDIATSLQQDGRSWIQAPRNEISGPPDARFGAAEIPSNVGHLSKRLVGDMERLVGASRAAVTTDCTRLEPPAQT